MRNLSKKIVASTMALNIIGLMTMPTFAYTKDETVYSKMSSDGTSYNTTVSEHIKNTDNQDVIMDISNLLGITNTNSDSQPNINGENVEWKSNGNDIYYQGNIDKQLPLDCEIKYTLDGNEISAKDLAGKSGKIKISINYTNKDSHTEIINGKSCTMYTPFVVFTGTILNNDKAKNITITNGKVVDNGNKSLVLGITSPGLKASLGLENNTDIDIPESIEIEFDATDFEMDNIMSYATPKLLEESDFTNIDKLNQIYSDVNKLSNSSKQIVDGATKLNDGAQTLSSGSKELNKGINTAYEGSKKIENSVNAAIKNLQNDTSDTLDSATLNQIKTQATTTATSTISAQKDAIGASAKQTAQKAFLIQNHLENATQIDNITLSSDEETAIASAYSALPGDQTAAIAVAKQIALNTKKQALKASYAAIGNTASQTAQSTATTIAGEVAGSTAESVATGVANNVKAEASKKIASQMTELKNGLNQLSTGLYKLDNGSSKLVTGTEQLSNGTEELKNGVSKFDTDGIQKIANLVNKDVKNLQAKIDKLNELSNEYKSFSGAAEDVKTEVKFIFIADSIKKNEDNKDTNSTSTEISLPDINQESTGKNETNQTEGN